MKQAELAERLENSMREDEFIDLAIAVIKRIRVNNRKSSKAFGADHFLDVMRLEFGYFTVTFPEMWEEG